MEVRERRKVTNQVYDSLSTDEQKENDDNDPQAKIKGLKVKQQSPYSIENVLWLISSIAIFYYVDFARVLLYDLDVKRSQNSTTRAWLQMNCQSWFYIGITLMSITIAIAFFLIVYLSWLKKMSTDDWELHYPAAIPVATACFAFGSFCITVALWPVWGVFTVPILFTQFMGFIVVVAALPPF